MEYGIRDQYEYKNEFMDKTVAMKDIIKDS